MLKRQSLAALFHNLQDTVWQLQRTLHSTNAAEPSGTCTGTAKFKSRPPAVFVDTDGNLQMAQREMLYTEEGSFHMTKDITKSIPFTFSRKYIWRLQDDASQPPEISIWFAKPGTEDIDYLFHKFLVQRLHETSPTEALVTFEAECSGGHLCIGDYYSSSYVFLGKKAGDDGAFQLEVDSWRMHHDVRGPTKDQTIETIFTKATGSVS